MDPRADRVAEAAGKAKLEGAFTSLEEAMDSKLVYDGAVIASPPHVHVEQSIALIERGVPLLLEKPVAPDLRSSLRLQAAAAAANVPVLLGYSYRWWEPIRLFHRLYDEQRVGRIFRTAMTMGAHLADWHPWEPYQEFFMANREQGGGALLDESHFVDLMLWILGRPRMVSATVDRIGDLQIETDDNVEINCEMDGGHRVVIHLDLYSRPHERSIRCAGSEGTLEWSYEKNAVSVYDSASGAWDVRQFDCERNDMFVGTAKEFVAMLDGNTEPSCTLADGVEVLRLIEAVRESASKRCQVPFPG